jgi:hypothetical protein
MWSVIILRIRSKLEWRVERQVAELKVAEAPAREAISQEAAERREAVFSSSSESSARRPLSA